jgi:Na+/glutamate symporter
VLSFERVRHEKLRAVKTAQGPRRKAQGVKMKLMLPFWQRLLLTIAAMLATSWIAGFLWSSIFSFVLPSYVAGMIGGLAALPCWELLKRIRPKQGG